MQFSGLINQNSETLKFFTGTLPLKDHATPHITKKTARRRRGESMLSVSFLKTQFK